MNIKTVTGTEAISYLVTHTFRKEYAQIEETNAYIDVDDAGRRKSRESLADYEDLMWSVLNYMPTEYSLRHLGLGVAEAIELVYRADIVERTVGGHTHEVIAWFHIETGVFDSESLGSHYYFAWEG